MRGACMQFIWAEMKRKQKNGNKKKKKKKGGKKSRTHNLVKATIKMLKEVLKRKYAHPFGRINGMSTSSRWQFGYCWDIYVNKKSQYRERERGKKRRVWSKFEHTFRK